MREQGRIDRLELLRPEELQTEQVAERAQHGVRVRIVERAVVGRAVLDVVEQPLDLLVRVYVRYADVVDVGRGGRGGDARGRSGGEEQFVVVAVGGSRASGLVRRLEGGQVDLVNVVVVVIVVVVIVLIARRLGQEACSTRVGLCRFATVVVVVVVRAEHHKRRCVVCEAFVVVVVVTTIVVPTGRFGAVCELVGDDERRRLEAVVHLEHVLVRLGVEQVVVDVVLVVNAVFNAFLIVVVTTAAVAAVGGVFGGEGVCLCLRFRWWWWWRRSRRRRRSSSFDNERRLWRVDNLAAGDDR